MAGGLLQLVAYGAQDVYLTGNPSITFFQAVYKRHTNFALETIQQTNDGSAIGGSMFSTTIQRNGDLLGEMFVQLKPKAGLFKTSNNYVADCNWVAERAFTDIEWQIGGQKIDKHYQTWWRLYSELYMDSDKKLNYSKMTTFQGNTGSDNAIVYLPLLFSFCVNRGLYLPLIALQYHEVKFIFNVHQNYADYFEGSPIIWAQYVLLDKDERTAFATKSHEYLIEQLQHDGGNPLGPTNENSAFMNRLVFNHPVKEIVWCYNTPLGPTNRNALWNFSSNTQNVQVSCNPQILYNRGSMIPPKELGAPNFVFGTTSNIFGGDGEFGTNFTTGLAGFTTLPALTVVSTASPNAITFSGSHGLQVGDILTVANAPASGVPNGTGITGNSIYWVIGTPTPQSVTVTTSWSSNLATSRTLSAPSLPSSVNIQAGISTVSSGITLTMFPLRPYGAGYTPVSVLPVNSIDRNGAVNILNTSGFKVNSILNNGNNLGLVFSNNFNSGAVSGNTFYITSIDDQFSNIMISNTYSANQVYFPETRFNSGGDLAANQVSALVVSLNSNVLVDNRPITNVPVEEGSPGTNVEVGPLHKFKFIFNGRERFVEQYGKYFNYAQKFYHHCGTTYPGIYSYSFALNPEDHQPSGTCNFSRIDMAQASHWLKTTSTSPTSMVCRMFAVNYNILKISSGMGGILYSN